MRDKLVEKGPPLSYLITFCIRNNFKDIFVCLNGVIACFVVP